MKVPRSILAAVWLISTAAVPAMAHAAQETARAVDVPAGDMADAVESLARQCDVDVMYPSAVLKGQATRGVSGMLAPTAAFGKLLEGTSFELSEDGGTLLITEIARVPAATTAARPETPLEQVLVEGWRETDAAGGGSGQVAETSGPRFVQWKRHEFWVACGEHCDYHAELRSVFDRLGARDLEVHDMYASFSSLVPVRNDALGAASPSRETARWVKVTIGGMGYHHRDDDRLDTLLYRQMKTRILPMFTTRNFKEDSSGRMSVEVLQAP